MGDDPNEFGNSRRWIIREVENSLRRLGTDWIDLYQIHRPEPDTDIDETLGALTDLVRAGKVRYIGSSTFPASARSSRPSGWREKRGRERFVCEQPPYSMLVRGIENDVLPDLPALRDGRDPLEPARRRLADRAGTGKGAGPARARTARERHPEPLRHVAARTTSASSRPPTRSPSSPRRPGMTLIEMALAFVIRHPAVTAAIIGPRTMEQLESQLTAADVDAVRRRARPDRRDRPARHQRQPGRHRLAEPGARAVRPAPLATPGRLRSEPGLRVRLRASRALPIPPKPSVICHSFLRCLVRKFKCDKELSGARFILFLVPGGMSRC